MAMADDQKRDLSVIKVGNEASVPDQPDPLTRSAEKRYDLEALAELTAGKRAVVLQGMLNEQSQQHHEDMVALQRENGELKRENAALKKSKSWEQFVETLNYMALTVGGVLTIVCDKGTMPFVVGVTLLCAGGIWGFAIKIAGHFERFD